MYTKSSFTLYVSCALTMIACNTACGRKGNPIPHARTAPKKCQIQWANLRQLEIRLPSEDVDGISLIGIERVRIYYLPLGMVAPSPQDVVTKGELLLEQRRPDLPKPGKTFLIDLRHINRPAGWIAISAIRVGDVTGIPSEVLPWLDPAF